MVSNQSHLTLNLTTGCRPKEQPKKENRAHVVDLCCGLGGLSHASRGIGASIVAGADLSVCALKTFSRNFPGAVVIKGSVGAATVMERCKKLITKAKKAGHPTVVVSGPPCQGFSMAGPRNPKDVRNRVLVAVAEAISNLQPDCALVENVAMVLSNKHDDRLEKVRAILEEGGYAMTSVLLNASEFGVSQKRKRAFFLITRKPVSEQVILEKLIGHKKSAQGAKEVLSDLPMPCVRPDDYSDEADYGTHPNHIAMQHSQRVMEKIALIPPGSGPMSYRRLHPTRPSNTLFSGHRAPPAHYDQPRSITVREAARLQGFPDTFRIFGAFANQMGQVTNAVPPPLAQAVLRVLFELAQIPISDTDGQASVVSD